MVYRIQITLIIKKKLMNTFDLKNKIHNEFGNDVNWKFMYIVY